MCVAGYDTTNLHRRLTCSCGRAAYRHDYWWLLDVGWINIAIGVILLVLALINPLSLWCATTAWRYRDPAANEPSEDALFLGREIADVTRGDCVADHTLWDGRKESSALR